MHLLITMAVLQLGGFALWLRSLKTKNVSVVDIYWGLGFAIVSIVSGLGVWLGIFPSESSRNPSGSTEAVGGLSLMQIGLGGMVVLWGTRLATYLAIRNGGKPEDYRYAAMRKNWGNRFELRSLFTVFILQSLLIWFISLPVQLAMTGRVEETIRFVIGSAIWLAGFLFESIGDWQMYRFKQDQANRGKVMNRGLWRYTRHPNYFGDFLIWWGIFIVAAQAGSWWWTILCPSLMSFLLLRVSGVTLLESSLKSRIEGYEEYIQKTSSFFPRPPKK